MELSARAFIVPALLALAAGGCSATASSSNRTDDAYTAAIPYTPARVASVTVTKPSEKSNLDSHEDCATFVMTPALVGEFFRHARPVSEYVRMHELDWSACFAEGRVLFSDHTAGDWMIARHGVGALTMKSGKWKDKTIFYHCAKCENWNK